jgi:molybdate transport system ATP-binding protein
VTIRQGSVTLLDEISFQIYSGEQWALLGPNGSGKSTLLSLILADNPQVYANHVAVAGKQLGPGYSIWDRKALLGWVSPELDVHFSPHCTTLEVVLSGFANSLGSYRVYSENEIQSAHACLNGMGLEAIQNHPFTNLSPVERRLVLLARAAVHRPYLLLLDEPCQGLDPPGSHRFLSAIESIIDALSASMIFVTHNTHEIPARVDHLLLLDQGHITYVGPRANYTQALPGY